MVLFLTKGDVESILKIDTIIEQVEVGYAELVKGTAVIPQRIIMSEPAPGITYIMPGMSGERQTIVTKIVTVYKNNPKEYGLPVILAKIIVQDFNTGEVVCVMDGSYITQMRTGAATAVSIKYLARKNSRKIALYGAGPQAEGQLIAACNVPGFNFEICDVYDINYEQALAFIEKLEKKLKITINVAEDPLDFVSDADVVICATTSGRPLFRGTELKPGTHVSSIGAHTPNTREIDSLTMNEASKIVAGYKSACLAEAGDFLIPIEEGLLKEEKIISIGDIILGKEEGRESAEEITVFKSVGVAIQDVFCAQWVYEEAQAQQKGTNINEL